TLASTSSARCSSSFFSLILFCCDKAHFNRFSSRECANLAARFISMPDFGL
ncbi:MAG: hypothetical protein ACI8X3_000111, partial [Saprospiraceae bacterium]